MKRILLILLSCFACLGVQAQAQQLDSLTKAGLSDKLDEYFDAIKALDVDAQKEEVDFLIGTATDSLVRQFVAVKVYDHYLGSPVMGAEAVAIHVLDKWFFDGSVKMYDDVDLLHARIFADFNRQSLIGEKAPQLSLLTYDDEPASLYSAPSEKYSVLYFYDTGCAKCKLENIRLTEAFKEKSYPIECYAVYAGDNKDQWKEYQNNKFNFEGISVTHLWDPEIDSDFQRKYGVLQTPRMFLISPDGTIVGRGLDTDALMQLLEAVFAETELEYGGAESAELFDRLLGSTPSRREIADVARMIEDATLGEGNEVMYRQLIGDYLYYLAPKTGEEFKEGLYEFIPRYILGREDIWSSEDDRMKVVGFAEIMNDLLSKAAPRTTIADLKVDGIYIRNGKEKQCRKNLRKLCGLVNIVIFHTEGCHICEAEIAQARELAETPKLNVFLVNVDKTISENPSLSTRLFDSFDLSALPFILMTDRKGHIMARYMTLQNNR